MLDLIAACILGVFLGTLTGLIPGIHVNTVGAFVFAYSSVLLKIYTPEVLGVYLISMSISHALLEFIPSMFLGVPDEGTAMSIMPGHQLLLQGRGREAIRLVAIGGYGGIIVLIITLPVFMIVLPLLYNLVKPYLWILLILIVAYMLYRLNKDYISVILSLLLFLSSGVMGWITLNSPLSSGVSLLCLFSGLFGVSSLLFSLLENSVLPPQQNFPNFRIDKKVLRGIFAGGVAGSILGFLPGMGPAQGTLIAQEISGGGNINKESFLVSMSGVNVSDALFSLVAIYLIGNPRSGIAVYIEKLIQGFDLYYLIFFIFVSLFSVSLSFILCIKLGDLVSRYIYLLDYRKLCWIVIIFMSFLVMLFALIEHSPLLFVVLIYVTSISLGIIPHFLGLNKSNLMGVLIIPAILVYLGIS